MTTKMLNEISDLLTSQRYLHWQPEWFGCKKIDDMLIEKIKAFQTELSIPTSGVIDSLTYRLLFNLINSASIIKQKENFEFSEQIIFNKKSYAFHSKLFSYSLNEFDIYDTQYINTYEKSHREVNEIIVEYDYCLTSTVDRFLSSHLNTTCHFGIDNAGEIYQYLDLQHVPFTDSEIRSVDKRIFVKITNPVIPQQNYWYVNNKVEQKTLNETYLMHSTSQDISLKKLIKFLSTKFNIKNVTTLNRLNCEKVKSTKLI
jgi:hypothetical protein